MRCFGRSLRRLLYCLDLWPLDLLSARRCTQREFDFNQLVICVDLLGSAIRRCDYRVTVCELFGRRTVWIGLFFAPVRLREYWIVRVPVIIQDDDPRVLGIRVKLGLEARAGRVLALGDADTATDWLLSFTFFSTAVRMCSESGA